MKIETTFTPTPQEKLILKQLLEGKPIYVSMFIKGCQNYANSTVKHRNACANIIAACPTLLQFSKGAGSPGIYVLNDKGKEVFADLEANKFTYKN